MSTGRRLAETIHLTALGLWLGTLVMAGVVAAIVFPTMRDLDPALVAFAAYDGPHWRLAAGRIASQVFAVGEIIGLLCLLIVGVSFGASIALGARDKPPLLGVRAASILLLIGAFGYQFFALSPRMNASLYSYWQAAAEGRSDDAARFAEQFLRDHPNATSLMAATTFFALTALVAGAWALTAGARPGKPAEAGPPPPPRLEEPLLARNLHRGRR